MAKLSKHRPVLISEVEDYLNLKPQGRYLDGTFGGGGHARMILDYDRTIRLIALDRDPTVVRIADELSTAYGRRFTFRTMSYADLDQLEEEFDGILFDLGVSTDQLEATRRGFSFTRDEPLDLRFDPLSGQSAAELLNRSSIPRLEKIWREFAEDRYWKSLARKIVRRRQLKPIQTTADFLGIVGSTRPSVLARLFQGLRIAVNDELAILESGLEAAGRHLKPGGRLVVISFHSLEDRLVKRYLRERATFRVLTKRPVVAGVQEREENPRSRSAKLRSAEYLGPV